MDVSLLLQTHEYHEIFHIICEEEQHIQALMNQFYRADYRLSQKLYYVLEQFKNRGQHRLHSYFDEWIDKVDASNHDAFIRNSYRYFQDVQIPNHCQGNLYQMAFQDMMTIENAVAIRVFSMTTCYNIAQHYPAMLQELKEAIELVKTSESKGIQARARHLLTDLNKVLNQNKQSSASSSNEY